MVRQSGREPTADHHEIEESPETMQFRTFSVQGVEMLLFLSLNMCMRASSPSGFQLGDLALRHAAERRFFGRHTGISDIFEKTMSPTAWAIPVNLFLHISLLVLLPREVSIYIPLQ